MNVKTRIKIMVICAHPDDAELLAGGLAIKLISHNHQVKFISVTNGNLGHHKMNPLETAKTRQKEALNSAKILGTEYTSLNVNDGHIYVNRELTEKIVRIIRNYDPDLILTHRVNDYHRDHRYCGQLVMDANNMLIVPHYCPDTPISKTRKQPVICYLYDHFLKPYPFIPNILLDITDVFDQKAKALICHKSQMMEWLPWTQKLEHLIPKEFDDNIRKKMVEMIITMMFSHILIDYQELWNKGFPGRKIQYGEAFEISEYGRQPTLKELKTFFPGAYIPSKQDLKG